MLLSTTVGEFFGSSGRKIRDPVWGEVPADRAVRALLATGAVQRLKGMSELGFTTNAFPGARHSRYDHAVGVYHLTRLTLKRIVDSGAYLEDRDVRGALAAALLLDVGRYPYAQAVESAALPGMIPSRELARRVIEKTDVADVLKEHWDLEPHNVFRLVARDGRPDRIGEDAPRDLTPTEHLLRDILFGSLDASALDRIVRDARGARLPYGVVGATALIETLRVVGQDNRAVLTVEEEGAGSLQSLVFSKYLLQYNVYGHHALRVPAVMFLRAVQDAAQAGKVDLLSLSERDDAGAFVLVQDTAPPASTTAALMGRLAERHFYWRALEFDERHPTYATLTRLKDDANWRRRVEEAWSRYLTRYRKGDAGPADILIDLPKKTDVSTGLRLIRRSPLPGERNPVTWQQLSGMTDEDLLHYQAPLHRIRIATANEALVAAVRRHAEELFTIAEEVG